MKSYVTCLALAIAVLVAVFAWYAWRVETRITEMDERLTYMEPCALLGKLEWQSNRLAALDRGDGFGAHIDAFAEDLKRGRKALLNNDISAATEALRRADREAQGCTKTRSAVRRKSAVVPKRSAVRRKSAVVPRKSAAARRVVARKSV